MFMFSIICVYNHKQILHEWLLRSLENQTVEYELILLNNTQTKFKSAAKALNYGGKLAKNEYLMFVHQDIDLLSDNWLEKAESSLKSLSDLGIAGVAGKKDNSGVFTNIQHDIPQRNAGQFQIQDIMKVQTLDECLIIIPRSIFQKMQFDEKACDDWHLYSVDYCLSVKRLGFEGYLLPLSVYHRSPGFSFSEEYYMTLKKLIEKHRNYYAEIFTTMGDWNTSYSISLQRNIIWKLIRRVNRIINKIRRR